ncbi:MAG: hypothetical protein AB9828_02600 [Sphaerochaetaceae bacterium]
MKRVFGAVEAIFDISYLVTASILAFILLMNASANSARMLAGIMALVLVGGDAFHLVPRILVIKTGREEQLRHNLGRGKQVASITMTVFYLLLWQIGMLIFSPENKDLWVCIIYFLVAVRIFLCLLPQNKWMERYPPVIWGMWRNIPFFLMGLVVAGLFFSHRSMYSGLGLVWLAIGLSFAFYLPVVLLANKNPRIGMLMLPKTCMYLWLLAMCLSL